MIKTGKIVMTEDIQQFLHAMHDKHPVCDGKQSMRNGTAGYIPFADQPKPVRKLLHRLSAVLKELIGHGNWGYIGLWSTRLPKGGYHIMHNHPEGWMSGVCYIDIPSNETGLLEFQDRKLPPETGGVVVFPSQMIHGVSCYEGEQPRLAVAFDLIKMEPLHA